MKKLLLLSIISFTQATQSIPSEVTCKAGMAGGVLGFTYSLANIYLLSTERKKIILQIKINAMSEVLRKKNSRLNEMGIKKLDFLPSIIAKPIIACFYTNPLLYQAPPLTRQDLIQLSKKERMLSNSISQYTFALNGFLALSGTIFGKLMIIQNEQTEFNAICATLGINPTDSYDQARAIYRRLVIETAPDRTGNHSEESNRRYRAINAAWNSYREYRTQNPAQFNQNTTPAAAPVRAQNQAPQAPAATQADELD
jgi:DnaJ domain.